MATIINITTGGIPIGTVKRAHGLRNVGFYCNGCLQFVAMAVTPNDGRSGDIEYASDGPIDFLCPYCNKLDARPVSDIAVIVLNEGNKIKS
jgi:hypothetical protein